MSGPEEPEEAARLRALRYELQAFTIDFWHEVDFEGGANAGAWYLDDAVFASSVRAYRGRAELDAFYARRRDWTPRVSLHLVGNFRIVPATPQRVQCRYVLTLLAADGVPVLPSRAATMVSNVEELVVRQGDGTWRYASRLVHPVFGNGTRTRG